MSSAHGRSELTAIACWTLGALLLSGCSRAIAAREASGGEEVEVGYGTQERESLTGAVGSVDVAAQRRGNVMHVEELLQGRVAGVSVRRLGDGSYSVRVRGAGAQFGSGEPLYVVDGVPLPPGSGVVRGINPRDVARIEVLKDASATAIYGARGGNGVILIATRKGP